MDKIVELEQIEFKNLPEKTTKINAQNLNKIQENTDNALKKVQNVMNEKFNSVFYQNEVTGENINIKDALDYKIEKVTVDGKSVQASTTGKNKLAYSLEEIKNTNTAGVWENNIYTYNGVTFKINDDLSIEIGGTFNDRAYLYLQSNFRSVIDKGTYILSGTPKGGSTSSYMMIVGINDGTEGKGNVLDIGNGNTLDTTSYTNPTIRTYIDIRSSAGLNKTFYPMLRLSSVDNNTYEPYTGGESSPNPSYPSEINNVGACNLIELNIKGKQLLDVSKNVDNGWFNNGVYNSNPNWSYINQFIEVKSNTYYTFSRSSNELAESQFSIVEYNKNKEYLKTNTKWQNGTNYYSILTDSSTKYIRCQYRNDFSHSNLQLEEGKKATTYEPYQSNSITIDLQDNELCSIADVKDELVIENGNAKIIKKIGKVIYNGSEGWRLHSINEYGIANFVFDHHLNAIDNKAISNYFISRPTLIAATIVEGFFWQPNAVFFRIKESTASTIDDFKSWLSTHNPEFYYVLATPQEIDLGSLSEENIKKLKTFAGTNNITVNASLDTNVSIKYGLDLKKYIDNKIENLSNS